MLSLNYTIEKDGITLSETNKLMLSESQINDLMDSLVANGFDVAKSLYEKDLVKAAKDILDLMLERGKHILFPDDVFVAQSFSIDATATLKNIKELNPDDMILYW